MNANTFWLGRVYQMAFCLHVVFTHCIYIFFPSAITFRLSCVAAIINKVFFMPAKDEQSLCVYMYANQILTQSLPR